MSEPRSSSTNYVSFFSGWAKSKTQINQYARYFERLSYDLRPNSTFLYAFWMVELRFMTQVNRFSIWYNLLNFDLWPRLTNLLEVWNGWATIYDPDQPIRYVFWVVELWSSTQTNQYAMCFELLSFDLRPRPTNSLCVLTSWATIYDLGLPTMSDFPLFEQRSRLRLTYTLCVLSGWATIWVGQSFNQF